MALSASKLAQEISNGDYASARKTADDIVKSIPLNVSTSIPEKANELSAAAEFYALIGDYKRAGDLFTRILPDTSQTIPAHASILAERKAFFLLEAGRYKEAEKYILSAKANGNSPRSLLLLIQYKNLMGEYQKAESLIAKLESQSLPDELRVDMLFEKSYVLSLPGRHEEADVILRECLDLCERIYPENHPRIAEVFQALAFNDLWREKDDLALEEIEKAMDIRKDILPRHKNVYLAYGIKGEALRRQGKLDEAKNLLDKALRELEIIFGKHHPELGMTAFWLGKVYLDQEEYDAGFQYMQQRLDACEKYFGLKHLQTMVSIGNFATECLNYGFDRKAEQLYSRTVSLDLEAYPKEASLSSMLYNLATLYKEGDHYHEAEPIFLRVLKIRERDYGPNDPRVANVLVQLAELYYHDDRNENVENYLLRAQRIYQEVYGPEYKKISEIYNDLGNYYSDVDEQEKAEEFYKKSLALNEKLFSEDSSQLEGILQNLADLYDEMDRPEDAQKIRKRLLMIQTNTAQSEKEGVVDLLKNLSDHYQSMEKNEEVDQLYKKISAAMKNSEDARSPDRSLVYLRNLGLMHKALGQFEDAEFIFDLLLENGVSFLQENPRLHLLLLLDKADVTYLQNADRLNAYWDQIAGQIRALVVQSLKNVQGNEALKCMDRRQFKEAEKIIKRELSVETTLTGQDNLSGKNTLVLPVSKIRIIATAAVVLRSSGWSLTVLPDRHDQQQIKEIRESLEDWWKITTRKEALDTLQWLKTSGHRERYRNQQLEVKNLRMKYSLGERSSMEWPDELSFFNKYPEDVAWDALYAWDMCRYVAVCFWSYAADYISEKELWDFALPVGEDILSKYDSWDELGFYYLVGRQYWLSTHPDAHLEHAIEYLDLLNDAGSVWRQVSWNMPSSGKTKFVSIVNKGRKSSK